MALILLVLFIAVPLAEIAVFIEVGGRIGALSTILAIVLTAVMGTFLLRLQGLQTLARVRQQMDRGELPARELFDGLCLLLAGALLLVPGFVTDAIGFLLFTPPLRGWLYKRLERRIELRGLSGGFHARPGPRGRGPGHSNGGTIIDGEFEDISDPDPDKSPGDASESGQGPDQRRLPR